MLEGFKSMVNMFVGSRATGTKGFYQNLVYSDGSVGDVTCPAGTFTKIWEYTVPAQQKITVGYGLSNTNEEGRMYCKIQDSTPNEISGWIRIAVANANETAIDTVVEQRTEVLSANYSDPTKWYPLPEIKSYSHLGRVPKEDDRIQVLFKPDNSATVSAEHSILNLPVTVYA